jgi:hypothetical protein
MRETAKWIVSRSAVRGCVAIARRLAPTGAILLAVTHCGGQTAAPADGDAVVGSACTLAEGCVVASCFGSIPGIQLPGGYCSKPCARSADCPGDAKDVVCGAPMLESAGSSSFCLRACDPGATTTVCREGYTCAPIVAERGGPTHGCWVQ